MRKSRYLCKYRKGYNSGCSATPPARSLVDKRRYLIFDYGKNDTESAKALS